jgi:hypothetical protein
LSFGLGHHSYPKAKKGKLLVMINAHEVTLASGPESVIAHFLSCRRAKKGSLSFVWHVDHVAVWRKFIFVSVCVANSKKRAISVVNSPDCPRWHCPRCVCPIVYPVRTSL